MDRCCQVDGLELWMGGADAVFAAEPLVEMDGGRRLLVLRSRLLRNWVGLLPLLCRPLDRGGVGRPTAQQDW